MNNKKILSLMLICALAISLGIGATAASAASGTSARGSKGEIDVYLIAGQSNAVGYGSGGLSTSIRKISIILVKRFIYVLTEAFIN